ncbi:MAG: ATP-dependent metallopeptidase FtsH/Yme1/Tma family protein, partial [Patescibacteria group bacterium]|nr:ATP-dependent metallopeptidase FtsH/Yme1/Tma family protein [Patescibacteria group bacterium]
MNAIVKNLIIIVLIFVFVSSIFAFFNPQGLKKENQISLSQAVLDINQGKVKGITVSGDLVYLVYANGGKSTSQKETGVALNDNLKALGADPEKLKTVDFKVEPEKSGFLGWLFPLSIILPILIFVIFFWMIFRQARAGAGQTFNFLKAPAKLFGDGKGTAEAEKITFKDIAGLEEAKEEIEEVVDFLKNP